MVGVGMPWVGSGRAVWYGGYGRLVYGGTVPPESHRRSPKVYPWDSPWYTRYTLGLAYGVAYAYTWPHVACVVWVWVLSPQ